MYKLYHIAANYYRDLRSLTLQDRRGPKDVKVDKEYLKEINFFLNAPTKQHKERMVRNGFVNWDVENTYVYEIDAANMDERNINYIRVVSIPQEREYNRKHFDNTMKEHERKYPGEMDTEQAWDATIDEYLRKRAVFLKRKYNIPEKFNTLEELFNHPLYPEWSNFEEHFEYNLQHGNKKQYASYIPHVQISVNKPVKYDDFNKL